MCRHAHSLLYSGPFDDVSVADDLINGVLRGCRSIKRKLFGVKPRQTGTADRNHRDARITGLGDSELMGSKRR